jgi:hypothetical protein
VCAVTLAFEGQGADPQGSDAQRVADRFYPADRLPPADAAERHSCAAILSSTPRNEPAVILSAYTGRSSGAVRVLRRTTAEEFVVAFESPGHWQISGSGCSIRLHDLDVDGRPEAIVNFFGVRASTGWVFAWDGATLTSLTPTRTEGGREVSTLLDPAPYDLAHEGPLRVVASGGIERFMPGQPLLHPAWVHIPGPSGLRVEKSILAVMGFRADVDPAGNVRPFRLLRDSSPPYTLRVINGDRLGAHRVTGASIRLNDVEVAGSEQVNARTEFTSVAIPALRTENRLTATLNGPPDASLIVLVEDSTPRQPD